MKLCATCKRIANRRTPRHKVIAFLALATLRARKGQFNAKTRSATIPALSQCVNVSAITKHSTAGFSKRTENKWFKLYEMLITRKKFTNHNTVHAWELFRYTTNKFASYKIMKKHTAKFAKVRMVHVNIDRAVRGVGKTILYKHIWKILNIFYNFLYLKNQWFFLIMICFCDYS